MCSTPSGTELHGNPVICPGSSAIFECRTTNSELLLWGEINGTPFQFEGGNGVGDVITESENVASLLKLNLNNGGNIGNRTSFLLMAPNNITMNIICSGGNHVSTCSRDINFIGNS